MFKDATIDNLDITNLNTSKGKYFEGMFANYSSNASLLNLSNMNVTNAVDELSSDANKMLEFIDSTVLADYDKFVDIENEEYFRKFSMYSRIKQTCSFLHHRYWHFVPEAVPTKELQQNKHQ